MDDADQNLIAVLQNAFPDKLIILLPSPHSSEVTLFYSDLQAVIDGSSNPTTFFVQSLRTSSIVAWGQEGSVVEAIMSAYAALRHRAGDSHDYRSAA
jgi:hypothetical protein